MKYLTLFIALSLLFACGQDATPIDQQPEQKTTPVETEDTQVDQELEEINQAIRADINNKDLYLKRAKYHQANSNAKSAAADINRAFKLDTLYLPTLLTQADFLSKSGKLGASLSILEKAKRLYQDSSSVYVGFSKLYLIARNNEKSLENADLAIKYDIYNAEAYYLKGYNFLESGDSIRAISSYQTAIEQDPDFFDAYLELGLIFSEKNDPLALEYYKNALLVRPGEKRALYSKGMYEQEHEMYNEAMKTYHEAIKANPDFKEAHYNLGYVYLFYLQLYKESQEYFTDAIKIDPNYVQAYYNRGYAFELLGDINNAAKDYRKALAINPSYDRAAQGLSRLN